MRFTVNIDPGETERLEASVMEAFERARLQVQSAMADAFYGIVMANFGSQGFMRPFDWQPLSASYARRVGRTFATLFVTGALKATVVKDDSNPEASTVSMSNSGSVPYALAHHHGNPGNFGWTQPGSGELPARRVFPLDINEEVIEEAQDIVTQAAIESIKGAFA